MEPQKPFKILTVDDNLVNLNLLEIPLTKAGYRVITAIDGETALKSAEENQPDLILLDVMMPGDSGFEVIQKLKKNSNTANIPVIFVTSLDEVDDKVTGFNLGAVDYITKPIHLPEVLARVRLHLKLSIARNSLIADQAKKLQQLRDAQTSMLVAPKDLPEAQFDVRYLSLLEAGGDFYDVLTISEDIYGYFVGDISGHDIATSYMTSAVKALLRQNCIPIYEPAESMRMINDVLREILSGGKYMTACYARLNRRTQRMAIISAGHPPTIYLPKNGDAELIELEGDVLGSFKNVSFGSKDLAVKTGDRFVFYSDGLIEDLDKKRIWTSDAALLLETSKQIQTMPLRGTADALVTAILGSDIIRKDDVVAMVVEV